MNRGWAKIEIPRDKRVTMSRTRYLRVDGIMLGWKYGRWSFATKNDRSMRAAPVETVEEAMDWIDDHVPLALTKAERLITGM